MIGDLFEVANDLSFMFVKMIYGWTVRCQEAISKLTQDWRATTNDVCVCMRKYD
jgi:hypothetical protein